MASRCGAVFGVGFGIERKNAFFLPNRRNGRARSDFHDFGAHQPADAGGGGSRQRRKPLRGRHVAPVGRAFFFRPQNFDALEQFRGLGAGLEHILVDFQGFRLLPLALQQPAEAIKQIRIGRVDAFGRHFAAQQRHAFVELAPVDQHLGQQQRGVVGVLFRVHGVHQNMDSSFGLAFGQGDHRGLARPAGAAQAFRGFGQPADLAVGVGGLDELALAFQEGAGHQPVVGFGRLASRFVQAALAHHAKHFVAFLRIDLAPASRDDIHRSGPRLADGNELSRGNDLARRGNRHGVRRRLADLAARRTMRRPGGRRRRLFLGESGRVRREGRRRSGMGLRHFRPVEQAGLPVGLRGAQPFLGAFEMNGRLHVFLGDSKLPPGFDKIAFGREFDGFLAGGVFAQCGALLERGGGEAFAPPLEGFQRPGLGFAAPRVFLVAHQLIAFGGAFVFVGLLIEAGGRGVIAGALAHRSAPLQSAVLLLQRLGRQRVILARGVHLVHQQRNMAGAFVVLNLHIDFAGGQIAPHFDGDLRLGRQIANLHRDFHRFGVKLRPQIKSNGLGIPSGAVRGFGAADRQLDALIGRKGLVVLLRRKRQGHREQHKMKQEGPDGAKRNHSRREIDARALGDFFVAYRRQGVPIHRGGGASRLGARNDGGW
ncbi:MAG: hypothetical protein BWZ10_02219 [candidate division BRC1 bacterium ADurb.BinA364]|nr:MAG: hypothetical protein BWZ10_02219 [candidate division BRC1 bacterium ADurb.BinA364]